MLVDLDLDRPRHDKKRTGLIRQLVIRVLLGILDVRPIPFDLVLPAGRGSAPDPGPFTMRSSGSGQLLSDTRLPDRSGCRHLRRPADRPGSESKIIGRHDDRALGHDEGAFNSDLVVARRRAESGRIQGKGIHSGDRRRSRVDRNATAPIPKSAKVWPGAMPSPPAPIARLTAEKSLVSPYHRWRTDVEHQPAGRHMERAGYVRHIVVGQRLLEQVGLGRQKRCHIRLHRPRFCAFQE